MLLTLILYIHTYIYIYHQTSSLLSPDRQKLHGGIQGPPAPLLAKIKCMMYPFQSTLFSRGGLATDVGSRNERAYLYFHLHLD